MPAKRDAPTIDPSLAPRPRTTIRKELSGSYTFTIDGVSFTLSQYQFEQLAQQVLDQVQRIVAAMHRKG
jgi:hypothetical protein